jgi:hypothetical protein
MNPLNETDVARGQARNWSGRLGNLAAGNSAARPRAAPLRLDTLSSAFPPCLSAILNHLRQRHQRRQQAAEKLRAQEFVMAP